MKRIAVVMGGPSAENEVSLRSGIEVLRHIDHGTWQVRAVVITQEKRFYFCNCAAGMFPDELDICRPESSKRMHGPHSGADAAAVWESCDAVFNAMHGSFGEDGVFQGYLESIGLPYTGSGVYASAVAMNKITSKQLYRLSGLTVAPSMIYGKQFPQNSIDRIAEQIGFPCFVKCPQSGSSRLMGRATSFEELTAQLSEFSSYADEIMVEKSITGTEFTCGVLDKENGETFALPPIEIRPKDTFFTFDAKYKTGGSDEIVPAPFPEEILSQIRTIALIAHKACGCSGISRTDMIMADGLFYVLETNTLPGLTSTSLIPKAFKAAGGTYSGLIDLLIRQALTSAAPGQS